jgi:hypothetical protein
MFSILRALEDRPKRNFGGQRGGGHGGGYGNRDQY